MLKKENGNEASILSFKKYIREKKMHRQFANTPKFAVGSTGFNLDLTEGSDKLDDSFEMY